MPNQKPAELREKLGDYRQTCANLLTDLRETPQPRGKRGVSLETRMLNW